MIADKQITLGSLFDGIGGFPYAASFFGAVPIWASEIMPQAVSVTMRHFPGMRHVGNITALNGAELPPVDIVTFGSPCQDLSTAGKRAGMVGERSGLFYEAIRIIDEMRDATNGEYPKYAVWENVPGALSSGNPRGGDFRAVLEAFTKTAVPIPDTKAWANAGMVRSGGANIAWRLLNACLWGVPQRRRRIFLVASFGGGCAGEVLFVEEGLRRYLAARGQAWQGTAGHAAGRVGGAVPGGCLTPWDVQSRRIHSGDGAWPALYGEPGGGHGYAAVNCLNPWETQQSRVFTENGASPAMAGADGGGGRNPAGLVFAAFCGGASAKARSIGYSEEVSPTLKAEASGLTAPCLCEPKLARTLTARGDGSPNIDGGPNIVATNAPAITMRLREGKDGGGKGPLLQNELSGTIATGNDQYLFSPCVVGVHQNQAGEVSVSETAYTLATTSNASSRNAPLVAHLPAADRGAPALSAAGITSKGDGDCFLIPECHGTLSRGGGQPGQGYPAVIVRHAEVHPEIAGTLCASGAGLSRPAGMASEPDLCVAYERPAYAIQGTLIGRQDRNGPNGSGINEDVSFTLTATDIGCVAAKRYDDEPIPIHDRATRHQGGGETRNGDGCGNGLGIGKPGDPAPTLSTGDKHAVAGIFNRQRGDMFKEEDIAGTQTARQCKDATDLVCEETGSDDVSSIDCRNFKETANMSGTLQAKGSPGYSLNCQNPIRSGYIVRRLTPVECERLQGFEDGWTAFGHDGKEISDTRRYQMLGNSVAIPCVAFVLGGVVAQMRGGDCHSLCSGA
jgi:DNA (cytosine-5)-methyltransferase 1